MHFSVGSSTGGLSLVKECASEPIPFTVEKRSPPRGAQIAPIPLEQYRRTKLLTATYRGC
jgi:hypothetical protein